MRNAELRYWRIDKISTGYVMSGYIFNDSEKQYPDDTFIQTSLIKSIDFTANIAVTLSIIYHLGDEIDIGKIDKCINIFERRNRIKYDNKK